MGIGRTHSPWRVRSRWLKTNLAQAVLARGRWVLACLCISDTLVAMSWWMDVEIAPAGQVQLPGASPSRQLHACTPPGLCPQWVAVDSAFPTYGIDRRVGPQIRESSDACAPSRRRGKPTPSRGAPAASRDIILGETVRKFSARCGYAFRQLKKDAPALARKCQAEMDTVIRAVETNEIEGSVATEASKGDAGVRDLHSAEHFHIASDDESGAGNAREDMDDGTSLPQSVACRVARCETAMKDLVLPMCKCPLLDDRFIASEDVTAMQPGELLHCLDDLRACFAKLLSCDRANAPTNGLHSDSALVDVLSPRGLDALVGVPGRELHVDTALPGPPGDGLDGARGFDALGSVPGHGLHDDWALPGAPDGARSHDALVGVPCRGLHDDGDLPGAPGDGLDGARGLDALVGVPGPEDGDRRASETVARKSLEQRISEELLHQQLLEAVHCCRERGPLTPRRRTSLVLVAEERRQEMLQRRQEATDDIEAACRSRTKGAIVDAYLEWLETEQGIDALDFTMAAPVRDPQRDKSTADRIAKISRHLRKRPQSLAALVPELEGAHPWSRELAIQVAKAEKILLGAASL